MKRAVPDNDSSHKRPKLDFNAIFDDPNLERNAKDVLEKEGSETGYLACRCYMAWKPTKLKHRTIIETNGASGPKHRFEVEFVGACANFFNEIEIRAQDEMLLALKGVKVDKIPESSRACNFPMKLQYAKGVIIKFVKRRGASTEGAKHIVNTWELEEPTRTVEDDWFITPRDSPMTHSGRGTEQIIPPVQHIPLEVREAQELHVQTPGVSFAKASGRSSLEPLAPGGPRSDRSSPARPQLSNVEIQTVSDPPPLNEIPAAPVSELTKKQRRKIKRQQRAALQTSFAADKSLTSIKNPVSHHEESGPSTRILKSETPASPIPNSGQPVPGLAGPLALKAGLFADSDKYHPLSALNIGAICHIIGIVTYASSPSMTRQGDWMCNIKLIDPSNIDLDNLSGPEGFQVNYFTKRYRQWLPQPNRGEVMVLRNVKITEYHGNPIGTGYHDKMQWAIYTPTTDKIRHGDLGDVPEFEGLADGFGYSFSPFFHPGELIIRYCAKLSDWWLEVVKKREESMGLVHRIDKDMVADSPLRKTQRQHRLISEAGPDVPPSGYFDCTVEILHGHMNDNNVYSLYVTDYTKNSFTMPVQSSWCPARLAEFVLKLEVWDEAVPIARGMLAGEYYSIKNVRMKTSTGGYLEGKVVQQKIQKLTETEATHNPYLKSLLERKKAWHDANGNDTSDTFEDHTIETAPEGKHFNCVVEVLHAEYNNRNGSCIYVTDYTVRRDLSSNPVKDWSADLEGRILKINLWDNQMEMAKSVEAGLFYSIKKLRLKKSVTNGRLQGCLGGIELLISLLNPMNNSDKLKPLRWRKEEWKKRDRTIKQDPIERRLGKTIADIHASQKCPNKFRVHAKIIDFHPWDLRNAIIIHCNNCQQDLPSIQRACFKCDDTDHEYVRYLYQLFFLLEDDEGSQLYVSVNDECPILEGLKRTDIRDDATGYRDLLNRLTRMLGNLMEVHEGLDKSLVVAPDTPILSLIVDSWEVEGKRAYCLAGCEDITK